MGKRRLELRLESRLEPIVLLMDGSCLLCRRITRFVAARDSRGVFRFASIQSPAGTRLLERGGLPTREPDTFVMIENGRYYTKSEAALRVFRRLGGPWPLLFAGIAIPAALRDWAYLGIRLFGKAQVSLVRTKRVLLDADGRVEGPIAEGRGGRRMRAKPIYVELEIATDMESLWKHTQEPELHRQWDLRFSDIDYLPRERPEHPQRFLYRTRIGFGLDIAGTGETRSRISSGSGERLSALVFGSDQAISLIRRGGGYWRYRPNGNGVTFSTKFDYEVRFGRIGRLFDRLLFRPLFGFATAWSFDALRIWLERGIAPAVSIQRAVVHYISAWALALLWLYEGLVPKLLFPEAGELQLFRAAGLMPGAEDAALPALGAAEIALGIAAVVGHRRRGIYRLQGASLAALAAAAIVGSPKLLAAPFNPLTLSLPMLAMCLVAAITATDVPRAGRCLRRMPAGRSGRGGDSRGIHIRTGAGG
ncbi:hypothetical protein J19TS2_23220 [Cohnella xylanilytica]|uniref:DoxX-like family protein n=1 Tax=Cohnella xylanilytica TaxID=557555 RepID=UPI001AFEE6F7|nr:DoxX-like family protein [Cohnella xylanilytica]GIO12767.1 hypothetical protein J19TS2_23220 [Cohnella xylanilytica]